MRVLVTGATGFIGYEVARLLAKKGFKPRLMVRRPERGLLLRQLQAEQVYGDLESRESLDRAVAGMDAVIHLGARATFEEYGVLAPTIVGGSVALMEAAAAAGVRRFVYGSSLFVYDSQSGAIDRTTPAQPRLAYGRAKLESERQLHEHAGNQGMSCASIRLPHVYGARDLFFSRLARGRMMIPGRRRTLFAHMHVHDAARVLIAATEQSVDGIWPVADRRATTWSEFFDVVRAHYPRFRYVQIPETLAATGISLLRPFQRLRGKATIMTRGSVIGWNLNLNVKPGVLWDDLGMEPVYPTIIEGIPAVLDDCVSFRWLHPLDDARP